MTIDQKRRNSKKLWDRVRRGTIINGDHKLDLAPELKRLALMTAYSDGLYFNPYRCPSTELESIINIIFNLFWSENVNSDDR